VEDSVRTVLCTAAVAAAAVAAAAAVVAAAVAAGSVTVMTVPQGVLLLNPIVPPMLVTSVLSVCCKHKQVVW
jgi:hypothetical protein